jgi:hypothetical protein
MHKSFWFRFFQSSLSLLFVSQLLLTFSLVSPPPSQAAMWDFWRTWYSSRFPRRGLGGSRGNGFCLIAPLPTSGIAKVWSERPTFVLQGSVTRLEVWAEEAETAFWTQTITEADRLQETIAVTAQPTYAVTLNQSLEPGSYQLRMYTPYSPQYTQIDLQVISSQERNSISNDLEQIDSTDEAAAVQRADYFAGQNLWLDFWQTVISAPVSEDWRAVNSNTIAALCPLLETSGTLPSVGASIAEDGNPYMEHRFEGRAGQTVEMTLASPELDTRLILMNSQGTVIEQIDHIASDQTTSKVITLLEDGEYTVQVQAINPQRRGEYDLTVVSKFGVN